MGPAQLIRDRNQSSGLCRNVPASPQLSRVAAELSHCTPPPVLSLTPTLQASVNWPNSTQSSLADCTRPSVQRSDSHSSVTSGAGLQTSESDDSVFLHSDAETPQRQLANKVNSETYAISSVFPETEAEERCSLTRSRSTKTATVAEQEEDTPNLFLDDYLLQNSYAARNLRSLRDGSYSESPGGSSSGEKSSLDTSHSDLQIRKKINVSLSSNAKCGHDCVADILKKASDAALSSEDARGAKTGALCESKELQRRDITDGSFGAGILPLSMAEFYDQSNPSFWSPVSSGGQKRLFDSVDRSEGHSFHADGATGLTQEILHVSIGDEHRLKRGHFQSRSDPNSCRDESLDLGRHAVEMHDLGEVSMPSTNYELEQVESSCRLTETTPRHSGQSKFKPLCTSSWGSPKDTAMPPSVSSSDSGSRGNGSDLPKTESHLSEDIVCVCSDTPEPAATKVSSHDIVDTAASTACCYGNAIQPDSEMEYTAGTDIEWLRRRRRVPFTDVCVGGLAHYSTRMADRTSDAMSPRWLNANIEAAGVSEGQQAAASNAALHTCHETDGSGQSSEVVGDKRCLTAAAIDNTDVGYRADGSSEASTSMPMEFPAGDPAPVQETVLSKYMAWEKLLPPANHSELKEPTEQKKKTKCVTHFMSLPSNHSNDHGQSDYFTPMVNRRQRSRAFMVSSPRVKVSQ